MSVADTPAVAQKQLAGCQQNVILTNCGGVPEIYYVTLAFMEELLEFKSRPSIFIVGDADRVKLDRVVKYIRSTVRNNRARTNLKLSVTVNSAEHTITLAETLRSMRTSATLRTIPKNLEVQIAKECKRRQLIPRGQTPRDAKDTIRIVAGAQYNDNEARLIRDSVSWLEGTDWLQIIGSAVRSLIK